MAELIKRSKPLSVSPLKASQPVGGILAFLGMNKTMPILHGSQGCSAFAKVFYVRHFREPIPLQTTAMDQISSVMGADDSVVEALKTVCEKNQPALIGLMTTGLSETQGTDIQRTVKMFREAHPEHHNVAVVAMNTPDFTGSLESGFAIAIEAMIEQLLPDPAQSGATVGKRQRQVNVLAGSMLTPGDVEFLKDTIEQFGLKPLLLPDLSDSMDGHLGDSHFSSVTTGGADLEEIRSMGESVATLVIGDSLRRAADLLQSRTGVPDYRFDSLLGLTGFDKLVLTLKEISGHEVPARIERQRMQLQDAMLDTHFMLGQARIGIAADPDLLFSLSKLLQEMGGELIAAVAPARAPILQQLPQHSVRIGDLEDLEQMMSGNKPDLLIGNSHALASAERLECQFLRAGMPQYDLVGGFQRVWIGYQGTRQLLFDLANLMLAQGKGEIEPYPSIYSQKRDGANDAVAAAVAAG